jgi:hypothetical protein
MSLPASVEREHVRTLLEELAASGWTDGLPVVPPFRRYVEDMIHITTAQPDHVVTRLDPSAAPATVEAIAANAVMAGCLPQHFPYVLAAVEAVSDSRFNLRSHMCSTHISTPLIIVGGPARDKVGFNYEGNCFGAGVRANAVVGRALNLCLVNIGGAIPQVVDRTIFGHPGKYTYCIAEHEAASPWDPLRVDLGFSPTEDTVTVYAAEAPHSIIALCAETPTELLDIVADSMGQAGLTHYYVGGDVVLVFGPAHAELLAAAGWRKIDVQTYLHEHTRKPISLLKYGGIWGRHIDQNRWPEWVNLEDESSLVPLVKKPKDIKVLVAGGPGAGSSAFIPGWGTRCITASVKKWIA